MNKTRKPMKVLLVNPYIYDFTAFDFWSRPLGLLYIASVLQTYTDCTLYWLDTLDRSQPGAFPPGDPGLKSTRNDGSGKFYREVVGNPDIYIDIPRKYARYGIPLNTFREKLDALPEMDMVLVTSLMTYWIDGAILTVNTLKERFPGAVTVLGGILPSLVPEEQLKRYLPVDHYIKGYGEKHVLHLVERAGAEVSQHPDLTIPGNLPYPAVQFLGNRTFLPLMTSRGCPFRCTYCASELLNPGFTERPVPDILEEIRFMYHTHGTRNFAFFDDALLLNKRNRIFRVFEGIRDLPDLRFHTPNGLHAREMDRETAELFFQSNFSTPRLSFESTTENILGRSSQKVNVREMEQAVSNLERAGYRRGSIDAYLLFGYPGQRLRDIDTALDFAEQVGVVPRLSYFSPVPGTADFNRLQRAGVLSTPVNLYETNKLHFLYLKCGLYLEEIQYVKDKTAAVIRKVKGN